ncbi:MAG: hypothetical protein GW917_01770 [Bdellovibrionales bacterium]|nr:hypothetical protein [Bdellovibrionales bacterium]
MPSARARDFTVSIDEEFNSTLTIGCANNDSRFCMELCGRAEQCDLPQPYCRDCLGTSSLLLREVFLSVSKLYEAELSKVWSDNELVTLLRKKDFILLQAESVYNYYTSYDSPKLKAEFQSLCPAPITENDISGVSQQTEWKNVGVIVQLDPFNRPKKLIGILCQNAGNLLGSPLVRIEEKVNSLEVSIP